jgi:hypothetical protein
VAEGRKRRRAHDSLLMPRAVAAVFFYSRDGNEDVRASGRVGRPDGSISLNLVDHIHHSSEVKLNLQ